MSAEPDAVNDTRPGSAGFSRGITAWQAQQPVRQQTRSFARISGQNDTIIAKTVAAPKKRRSFVNVIFSYLVFGGVLLGLLVLGAFIIEHYGFDRQTLPFVGGAIIGSWLLSVFWYSLKLSELGRGGFLLRTTKFVGGVIALPVLAAVCTLSAAGLASFAAKQGFLSFGASSSTAGLSDRSQLGQLPQLAMGPLLTMRLGTTTHSRVALVIGNSGYRTVPQLPNAGRDADSIASMFRSIGFKTVQLSGNLDGKAMRRALLDFGSVASTADWAVVYYAGHGIEVAGKNYLVPVDARLATDQDVELEAIALDQVIDSIGGARKLRLIILDACRENPFVPNMKIRVASRAIGRGLAGIDPEGATLVAYSAKGGQVALDGDGANSPYASALLRHLAQPGLEIDLLFRRVRDDVLKMTGNKQEPFVYGTLPADQFFLNPP